MLKRPSNREDFVVLGVPVSRRYNSNRNSESRCLDNCVRVHGKVCRKYENLHVLFLNSPAMLLVYLQKLKSK